MKIKILAILLLAATLGSCSKYYKLLKSDDALTQYQTARAYYDNKKYEKAKTLFDSALPSLVGTQYEDTLLFTLSKCFYERGDYSTAGEMMDQFRSKYPRSSFTPEAEYIYAMSFYELSADVEKDQTATKRALTAFGEYINRYPQSRFTPEIQQLSEELTNKLYYKKYLNAALYYKLQYYQSAVTSLRAVVKENPETPYREEIEYLICKSWFEYARNSVPSRQLDRFLNTIDAYYNFIALYPESKQFGRELGRINEIAQDFVDKNGATSQAIESSIKKVEAAQKTLEECKDALFTVRGKEAKQKIRKTMKESRETIKVERKKAREEEKIIKANRKKKLDELKELEETLEQEAADAEKLKKEERKKRVEELREEQLSEE